MLIIIIIIIIISLLRTKAAIQVIKTYKKWGWVILSLLFLCFSLCPNSVFSKMDERIAIKVCMPVGRAPGHQKYPNVVAKLLLF